MSQAHIYVEGGTLVNTGLLVMCECHCGIQHAIPDNLHRHARKQGAQVYCPLGHTWVYTETENDRLRKEAERARRAAKAARDLADHEARRAAAARGQVTKLKNRIANGVCPCCHRSFVNVQRHMKTKHPDFRDGDE